MSESIAVLEVAQPEQKQKPKRQPRYHVVLWDDPEHTYEYVVRMVQMLFGATYEKAFLIAREVDTSGRAILLTTTKEHAELKRDQILSFGRDPLSMKSRGSMYSSIEPEYAD